MELTPDVFVSCPTDIEDEVRAALATVPIVEETAAQARFHIQVGEPDTPREVPTFRFAAPMPGGRFIRGTPAATLVAFNDGRASLSLASPPGFSVRTFKHARLVFQNLPMPLPPTPAAARRVHMHGEARDGVMLLTNAMGEWNFDVRLPTAGQALEDWAADHRCTLDRSPAGRDAEALLRRVGTLSALDMFANDQRLAVLRALAPRSRVKLARRFVAEARQVGARIDEQTMIDKLADVALFLEIEARTAAEIAGTMGTGIQKGDVLELLGPLVEAGFVRRARDLRCPQCRFRMLLDLGEQDERVRCRACGELFAMPVADASGRNEPALLYRLDGLMARAMDQDLLPVVLALRALRPAPDQPNLFFAWPGVLLAHEGRKPVDVDLLISDGRAVWCYEIKNNANGLHQRQLGQLTRLAADIGARPGIAALEGSFAPELTAQVTNSAGRVLERNELLT
jgi:hypothetical protein